MKDRCRVCKILCLFALIICVLGSNAGWLSGALPVVRGYSAGPPASHTGAPGETTCVACHRSYAVNGGGGLLTLGGLPAEYQPGQMIELTVTLFQAGQRRYGLQVTALDEEGKQAGMFVITESTRTQLQTGALNGNARVYLEHTQEGILANATGRGVWQFKWIAPPRSAGRVTFYVAANAANGNNTTTGDYIYARTFTLQAAAAPGPLATVSAASFSANALAAEALVAAFGTGLATVTQAASVTPLPTTLAGTAVIVRDRLGIERNAPLIFVSPSQVNYQIPPGTASGEATVTVALNGVAVATGRLSIERLAPGFFSANANGAGWAAAVALRVKANGVQQFEPITQFDTAQNRYTAVPLDLGPEGEQVFLVSFGTGFRYNTGLGQIKATLGGRNTDVSFAGAQGQLAGLDQLNLRIPRDLAGRGELELEIEFEGQKANKVKILVR